MHYVAATGNADILSTMFNTLDPGQIQLAINCQSAIGWSPMCAAAARGHLRCVQMMLEV